MLKTIIVLTCVAKTVSVQTTSGKLVICIVSATKKKQELALKYIKKRKR